MVIAVAATISGVLLLGAVGCFCFWRNRARRKKGQGQAAGSRGNVLPFRVRKHTDLSPLADQRFNENKMSGEDDVDLPLFDLAVILASTDSFAAESKLGEGGFGPVYLGRLQDGQEVAVKRLSTKSSQGVEEFKNEVKLIAKLQHKNLVRLLGCCIDGEERLLVYEFMPNNSLDTFIFDAEKLGLPCADMRGDGLFASGYMSPEYAMDGVFSIKSDIYSFGVMVLEIVSGKKIRGFYDVDLGLNLCGYAWMLWKEGRSSELLDEAMGSSCNHGQVRRCIQVALMCVDVQPRNRPLMSSAVMMLASENATLPEPNEPGVNAGRNTSDTGSSRTQSEFTVTATNTR
ncbi:hypothetical protein ACQ4PT_044007 [Festuca glaucescens]